MLRACPVSFLSKATSGFEDLVLPIPIYCVHPVKIWAPSALGLMAAQIEKHLSDHFQLIYPFAFDWEQLRGQLDHHGPGVLLASNYMWTRSANLEYSALAKAHCPELIVVHGGPDTPAYEYNCAEFLQAHPAVDFAIHGEGETTILELLECLRQQDDPAQVAGLGFLREGQLIKTAARPRSEDPNQFPSPYLSGVFDKLDYQDWNSVTLETNRGCPYGCTFCDWGSATLQKIRRFDMERIRAEIEWIAKARIPKIWIADSNFGIFERDLEITRMICDAKARYGFPQLMITNYAKNTKQNLVDIIEMLVEHGLVGTGIVSLQTRDQATLKAVKRSNIKTREYDKLRETFEKRHLPMSTQLMIGLPGSTRESFKADLRYFFHQVIDVQIFRTVLLPNSPMAAPEYIAEHELRFDDALMITGTRELSEDELKYIEQLGRLFRCTHTYGMFRYWLCFLDWEYGIDPIDVLDDLVSHAQSLLQQAQANHVGELPDAELPILARLWDRSSPPHDLLTSLPFLREELRAQAAWSTLYDALKDYTLTRYPQVRDDSALDCVFTLQTAVMPHAGQAYPQAVSLPHDFVRYFAEHRQQESGPALRELGPAQFIVEDPLAVSEESLLVHIQHRSRPMIIWELQSSLTPDNTEAALYVLQKTQSKVARSA